MINIALQISPLAQHAYFDQLVDVAKAELALISHQFNPELLEVGGLNWLCIEAETHHLEALARLSWVQGIYEQVGDGMKPLDVSPNFELHGDFVHGLKYKGKTSEILTQLLLNVGLAYQSDQPLSTIKLLDPMCGRGTTLLWAMRYGIKASGVDADVKAIDDVQRNLKKLCKLHRQKHQLDIGFSGKKNKRGDGRYLSFSTEGRSMRLLTGDARECSQLLNGERYDIIATDMPYGVQHAANEKNVLLIQLLEALLSDWLQCLKKDGVIVLSFNAKNPRKTAVIKIAEELGFLVDDLGMAHRMSESIVRDVLVLKR